MRRLMGASLLFCCLWLCLPQATAAMLSADMQPTDRLRQTVTLYFRYLETDLLAREQREISYSRSQLPAMAIAAALIEGPGSLSPWLNPLFPPGTQVLSAMSEDDRLFLTFNEALMGRYSDEALVQNAEYRQGEGLLRRRLAMASLVNSLTESGLYSSVQVLVRGETYVASSMRLSQRYYLEDSNELPPPLHRQEGYVLSPRSATNLFMAAWLSDNWQPGLKLVRSHIPGEAIPAEHELLQLVARAPRLLSYDISPGIVAMDGQSAVVCLNYSVLLPNGQERHKECLPLSLQLKDGLYTIPYDAMLRLLALNP